MSSEVKPDQVVAVRVTPEQEARLAALRAATGRTNSEIMRALLDAAIAKPTMALHVDLDAQLAVERLQPHV